jgi:hypothetical protein
MTERQQELLGLYRATPDILRGLTATLTDEQARAGGTGNDTWSVVEVVCHLRDAEERSLERTHRILTDDRPLLLGYDEHELSIKGHYREQRLSEMRNSFIQLRNEHTALLFSVDEPAWQRVGRHNQMGDLTVQEFTHHMAYHDATHLAQIARRVVGERGTVSFQKER